MPANGSMLKAQSAFRIAGWIGGSLTTALTHAEQERATIHPVCGRSAGSIEQNRIAPRRGEPRGFPETSTASPPARDMPRERTLRVTRVQPDAEPEPRFRSPGRTPARPGAGQVRALRPPGGSMPAPGLRGGGRAGTSGEARPSQLPPGGQRRGEATPATARGLPLTSHAVHVPVTVIGSSALVGIFRSETKCPTPGPVSPPPGSGYIQGARRPQ